MVTFTTRKLVHEEDALEHRGQVPETHQRTGNPDPGVHGHALLAGEGLDFLFDAIAAGEVGKTLLRGTRRIDHARTALPREVPRLLVGLEEGRFIMEARGLDDFHPEGLDNRTRILVHDRLGRPGELDAIAMHDKGHRGSFKVRNVEPIQGLAGNPTRITAVANYPGIVTVARTLTQGLADRNRNHDPKATPVELRTTGYPGDMTRDVEPTTKTINHEVIVQETEGGQRSVIADAGMRVFNREVDLFVIGQAEGEKKGRNQFQAATEMVELVDFRQRGEGGQRGLRGGFFQGIQGIDLVYAQSIGRQVDGPGQDRGGNAIPHIRRGIDQGLVTGGLIH